MFGRYIEMECYNIGTEYIVNDADRNIIVSYF